MIVKDCLGEVSISISIAVALFQDQDRVCPEAKSFANAAIRFKDHYYYDIWSSAVVRSSKNKAQQTMQFIEYKFSNADFLQENSGLEKMLLELDGCEIRTMKIVPFERGKETTALHGNRKNDKIINWRDVRFGFVRPLNSEAKIFSGKIDLYQSVVSQMHSVAVLIGMTSKTENVGVADWGKGLSGELKRQFPSIQFILDKSHFCDHLYDTVEARYKAGETSCMGQSTTQSGCRRNGQ